MTPLKEEVLKFLAKTARRLLATNGQDDPDLKDIYRSMETLTEGMSEHPKHWEGWPCHCDVCCSYAAEFADG